MGAKQLPRHSQTYSSGKPSYFVYSPYKELSLGNAVWTPQPFWLHSDYGIKKISCQIKKAARRHSRRFLCKAYKAHGTSRRLHGARQSDRAFSLFAARKRVI